MKLESTIKCPYCGFKKEEKMPTDSCQYFYECVNCKRVLKPQKGDCCVFCSYGSVKCPPLQKQEAETGNLTETQNSDDEGMAILLKQIKPSDNFNGYFSIL